MKIFLLLLLLLILLIYIIVYSIVHFINYRRDEKLIKLSDNIIKYNLPNIDKLEEKDIPKVIHQTNETIEKYLIFDEELEITKKSCPDYQFKFYNKEERIEYIKNNYDKRVLDSYLKISDNFGPCKADFFRYLVLYNEGGIYLDNKTVIVKNIDDIIEENKGKLITFKNTNFFLDYNLPNIYIPPKYYYYKNKYNMKNGEFGQWFIISNKGNKILKNIIEKIIVNIEAESKREEKLFFGKPGVLLLTGPIMFTDTIIENNYENCKILNQDLNHHVKYKIRDHKKITKNHYSKHRNKNVIL